MKEDEKKTEKGNDWLTGMHLSETTSCVSHLPEQLGGGMEASGKRGQHTQRAFFSCIILITLSLHKADYCLSSKLCKKWWWHGHGLAAQWTNLSVFCRFV
ncbi:unnamed protein product [Rangifer tarandus platyrhynchus]|uniref:Uncharacterized protein n=2 Tax=Rangifer tarandus platyrhynchus TaxID=3082113 RepID=A0ACB0EY26_RANTA|nr:unnamed protein product [Rangifer tarandus platyrhynchus]CAI9705354.1 unnamed protein product [Rangifer tarandus platyrhynchus]